ncbi:MAG: DUF2177 family protein [Eubacteriales bacterium]
MTRNILSYFIILAVFLVLDIAWIGFIAKKFYNKMLGFLMKKKPNLSAAVIFYMLYIFGLLFFVVNPALSKDSQLYAFIAGGLFGLISYSTYDLTNLATIKDWPLKLTIIDLIWGSVLSAVTSLASYHLILLLL